MRKIKRDIKIQNSVKSQTPIKEIIVYKRFLYMCQSCCHIEWMNLEIGLEDHSENHKPVPFGITCPKCRNSMYHSHWDLDETFEPRPLMDHESYFENNKTHDCGNPIIMKGKYYE